MRHHRIMQDPLQDATDSSRQGEPSPAHTFPNFAGKHNHESLVTRSSPYWRRSRMAYRLSRSRRPSSSATKPPSGDGSWLARIASPLRASTGIDSTSWAKLWDVRRGQGLVTHRVTRVAVTRSGRSWAGWRRQFSQFGTY